MGVAHDGGAIAHDGVRGRETELTRSLARSPELAQEGARTVEHEHPQVAAAIEHIQVTLLIKRDPRHGSEHLPRFAELDPDPVDLLEIGLDPTICGREFNDVLGVNAGGRG